jgi:glutamine amidotransferase
MTSVAIVDYGMCNIDSVVRAVEECGGQATVTADAGVIASASRVILPGVGAFPAAMRRLRERSLDVILSEQVMAKGTPFLGICLGMQLLATTGSEGEATKGLGWIDGEVRRLEPAGGDQRIPHIGWSAINIQKESPLLASVPDGTDFYFVHSYALYPSRQEDIVATTNYGAGFTAAVQRGNVFGLQFHPEKSQRAGFRVLKSFLAF